MRLIVIGAGVAGLTAADAARWDGVEVIVLEARERIGGRTWTERLGEGQVDLGAAWVHGPVGNPLAEALAAAGIGTRNFGSFVSGMAAWADGWLSGPEATTLAASFGADWDPAQAAAALAGTDAFTDGIEWFLEDRELTGRARELARFGLRSLEGGLVIAGQPERISLAGAAAYTEGEGGNLMPDGGYRTLADRLADGLDVRLDTPVTALEHRAQGVVAHTDRGTFEADRAVVAVPLGVLKAGTIDLDPQPAEAQRLAVERLAMGTLEKVVFRFDRRFWPEEVRGIVHVSEESAFPYWCDLSAHAGAPTLATLYNPLLTTRVAEQPAEHRAEAGLEVLSRMFPEVPDPEETLFTDWIGDPWARGSYSYIPIGATVEDMRALAEPVSERLVLAGEVTVAESYGTVHAAFRSGLRAAGQVLGRRPERISLGPVAPSWVARP